MKKVEPKVYLIGETKIIRSLDFDGENIGLNAYLNDIGAGDWNSLNPPSQSEELTEIYGRICYRSFKPGLNPNVTKVREGNDNYLKNIHDSGHGSVIEHSVTNWIFKDISRVLTHELCRHRVGIAISQESLRYVRLTDLSFYTPSCIEQNEEGLKLFVETIEQLEEVQRKLSEIYDIDNMKDFKIKKELTSAFRRVAPDGLCTTFGWSVNFRSLRQIIELRTSPHAEEEIRVLFAKVWNIASSRYPNMFLDFETEIVDNIIWAKKKKDEKKS